MSTRAKLLACLVSAAMPCLLSVGARSDETYTLKAAIPIPGGLTSFDISFVDANAHTYVLADRTNKSIDVIDTTTNTVIHQYTATPAFQGAVATPANDAGPNGALIVDGREIWAADAPLASSCSGTPIVCTTPSAFKVIDLQTGAMIANIPNGGVRRADELCEDVKHELVLGANDDTLDNFLTVMDVNSHSILQKIKLDGTDANGKITLTPAVAGATSVAANGIEQCKFNPRTHSFYLAVPATTVTTSSGTQDGPGVVLVISGKAPFHVERTITVPAATGCTGPQGLAIGPRHEIQLGCGGANSVVIDERSGATATVLVTETGEGGADEVWYNPGDNSYFIARSSAGALGVADAGGKGKGSESIGTDADVTTTIGSHSVAADMVGNQIYVPIRANTVAGTCTTAGCATLCGAAGSPAAASGCVAVITTPNDDSCLAQGMPVLDHDANDDPVFMRTRCHDHDASR